MNLPVVELFHSIQGEGIHTGVPSIFLRVTGCNLRCVFKGSICDTSYTSFEPASPIFTTLDEIEYAIGQIKLQHPNTKHLVITGGEPLLYKEGIKELLSRISNMGFYVTVETNGTKGVIKELLGDFPYVDLYSVSPKLSTSVDYECKYLTPTQRDRHAEMRINYNALAEYFTSVYRAEVQLKFVYSGEASICEIENIIEKLNRDYKCDITPDQILLMPEGATQDQLEANSLSCAEECIKRGWRFCDRLHIRIWNDKKCV